MLLIICLKIGLPYLLILETFKSSVIPGKLICSLIYRKSSIKPPGAYLISDLLEGGGLYREGAYSKNQVGRIYLVFSSFIRYFARNQRAIFGSNALIQHSFYPTRTQIMMQCCVAK